MLKYHEYLASANKRNEICYSVTNLVVTGLKSETPSRNGS